MDQALRTGTVIYALDPRGLRTAELTSEDNVKSLGSTGISESGISRKQFLLETQDTLAYMAEETGGLAVLNNNDLSAAACSASATTSGATTSSGTPRRPTRSPRRARRRASTGSRSASDALA